MSSGIRIWFEVGDPDWPVLLFKCCEQGFAVLVAPWPVAEQVSGEAPRALLAAIVVFRGWWPFVRIAFHSDDPAQRPLARLNQRGGV